MVPCAEMVRFFKGGVEANSAALRIARAYTGREIIVSCGYRGWHDTLAVAHTPRGIPSVLAPLISSSRTMTCARWSGPGSADRRSRQ